MSRFQRSFRLSSTLLLLTGFSALWVGGTVGHPEALLLAGALFLLWSLRPIALRDSIQFLIVVLSLAGFVADVFFFSTWLQATVHLLAWMSLLKMATAQHERDYLVLYFISFAFLLLGTTFTIRPAFFLILLVYIYLSILTFILLENRRGYDGGKAPFTWGTHLRASLIIFLLILVMSVPIFVLIPRSSFGIYWTHRNLAPPISGFSDRVSLGDIGRIIQNHQVVFRAQLDPPVERLVSPIRWRGVALDHFDGKNWSNTAGGRRRVYLDVSSGGFLVGSQRRQKEFLIRQVIHLEPVTNILFGVSRVISVSQQGLGTSFILQDGNQALYATRYRPRPVRYTVYSDFFPRTLQLRLPPAGREKAPVHSRYLQLPELRPEIQELARQIVGPTRDPLQQALLIEAHLRENYRYSLDNLPGGAEDPLFDFLFRSQEGHCEYFASAQAVLMRVLGIPSRLVNGFRQGDPNPWNSTLVVRQSDAHSWVEGYFPAYGWVEFDPTPTGSGEGSGVSDLAAQFLDAFDLFWTEVVTFDQFRQAGFFWTLSSGFRDRWEQLREEVTRQWERLGTEISGLSRGALLIGALLAGLILLVRGPGRLLRRGLAWRTGQSPSEGVPDYYAEMLRLLDRQGYRRRPSETPREFVTRIGAELRSDLPARLTDFYYRQRYGGHLPGEPERREIELVLQALRR